ncbi:MAG: YfiR/HmsC family protein, partial [Polyangiaceae bacterium]
MNSDRRHVACGWLIALLLLLSTQGGAQSMQVPSAVQAGLMVKVAAYDRNFPERAGRNVVVLLVAMPGKPESMRAAMEMKGTLSALPSVGDLPHEEQIVSFSGASALADLARSRKAAIVYIGPELNGQIGAIRDAFSTIDVLTVAAIPDYVPAGIVLGFDLVSGRPKLLLTIGQARKQHIALPA